MAEGAHRVASCVPSSAFLPFGGAFPGRLEDVGRSGRH